MRLAFMKKLTARAFSKGAGSFLQKGGAFMKKGAIEAAGIASLVAPEFAPAFAAAGKVAQRVGGAAEAAGKSLEAHAAPGVSGVLKSVGSAAVSAGNALM